MIEHIEEVPEAKPKATARSHRRNLILLIALGMALFHLYTAGIRQLPGIQQRSIHLAFALALTFLLYPFRRRKDGVKTQEHQPLSLFDLLLVLFSFAIGAYGVFEYESFSYRVGHPTFFDSLSALIAVLLVMEGTRRILGFGVVFICLAGFAYLGYGENLPSYIAHTGFTFERIINYMFLTTEGIMGSALGVSATVIVTFIIFGAFLQASGAGQLFIDTGMALFGRYRGGPAKAAVLGSCFFGMVSGSQVANVGAVGVFTIPLMKKGGYKPEMAAAIEAVGSTGSMIMPPVMGAAAFIIPEIIGGTYLDVVKAAMIPALLFYTALYMVVELQARQLGLQGFSKSMLPDLKSLFREKGHMLIPIGVLIYSLAIKMTSPSRAAFWAIVSCFIVSQFRKSTRMGIRKVASALEKGARGSIIVANACASAGIITGAISLAGLGLRFSDALITFAGGSLLVLLILTMFASLVLGLPLPPVSCYLILAVLAAPSLVKLGVPPMAAHLFVFFYGILGNISPPVAPTSFAAAGVAGTHPMKTTNLAFLYSLPTWLIPYLFVYSTEILLMGSALKIALRVMTSFLAISCMAVAFQGYLFNPMGWLLRLGFLVTGLFLIYPYWVTDVMGYFLLGLFLALHVRANRSSSHHPSDHIRLT